MKIFIFAVEITITNKLRYTLFIVVPNSYNRDVKRTPEVSQDIEVMNGGRLMNFVCDDVT